MEKRGQVSIFVIIGIVVLILVALVFYLRETRGFLVPPAEFLASQLEPIQANIDECVAQSVAPGVVLLGEQGGSFDPTNYRLYEGRRVRYFCQNIPGESVCLNSMPALDKIGEELQTFLEFEINNCVDRELVTNIKGVETEASPTIEITTELQEGKAIISVDWDVKLIKDGAVVELQPIRKAVEAPLEELYLISRDVVQAHATAGEFDQLIYMLQKKGTYEINVDKPFPDTIYKINKKNSEFSFWFAVEGESNL